MKYKSLPKKAPSILILILRANIYDNENDVSHSNAVPPLPFLCLVAGAIAEEIHFYA